jgi:hypothetical protein
MDTNTNTIKKKQIFKTSIDKEKFIIFLKNLCEGEDVDNEYKIDNNIYKKGIFTGIIQTFLEDEVKPHYFNCKKFYVEREITYKNFITIIRQLCNLTNIEFKKKMIYNKSEYEINYIIKI